MPRRRCCCYASGWARGLSRPSFGIAGGRWALRGGVQIVARKSTKSTVQLARTPDNQSRNYSQTGSVLFPTCYPYAFQRSNTKNLACFVVGPTGFEPVTSTMST